MPTKQPGLTLREAADSLGVTPDNLRAAIARHALHATKYGRDWFVTPEEVEHYRAIHRRPSKDAEAIA